MTGAGDLIAGRYRVGRPLAAGRMGQIWLGDDERTGRTIVLKKCGLPDTLTPRAYEVVRVWVPREARAFARIRHPNVIRTLDVLLDGDASWIVMEYVPSRSLLDVIWDEGALPPARVAAIGLDLLAALTAAWEADVLHLDVKPSNVLIAENGRVVLTDFGPAGSRAGVAALADVGVVFGSAKYVAPERLFGGVSDEHSDLWSLGATLYYAVEGRAPFQRSTTEDGLRAAHEGRLDPPERAGALTPVLLGLLRRDPAERMSAAEVRSRLRRIAPPTRRVRALRAAVAVVAAAALIVLGGVALAPQRSGADQGVFSSPPVRAGESSAPPSGYSWWTQGGYRVAMPRGWRPVRSSGGLVLAAPGGRTELTVTPWTARGALVPALITAERQAELPGYRRVRIATVTEPVGAVWEYTFQEPHAGAVRALRQIVIVGGRSYAVDWHTPAAQWAAELPTLLTVLPTVGPAPGA